MSDFAVSRSHREGIRDGGYLVVFTSENSMNSGEACALHGLPAWLSYL